MGASSSALSDSSARDSQARHEQLRGQNKSPLREPDDEKGYQNVSHHSEIRAGAAEVPPGFSPPPLDERDLDGSSRSPSPPPLPPPEESHDAETLSQEEWDATVPGHNPFADVDDVHRRRDSRASSKGVLNGILQSDYQEGNEGGRESAAEVDGESLQLGSDPGIIEAGAEANDLSWRERQAISERVSYLRRHRGEDESSGQCVVDHFESNPEVGLDTEEDVTQSLRESPDRTTEKPQTVEVDGSLHSWTGTRHDHTDDNQVTMDFTTADLEGISRNAPPLSRDLSGEFGRAIDSDDARSTARDGSEKAFQRQSSRESLRVAPEEDYSLESNDGGIVALLNREGLKDAEKKGPAAFHLNSSDIFRAQLMSSLSNNEYSDKKVIKTHRSKEKKLLKEAKQKEEREALTRLKSFFGDDFLSINSRERLAQSDRKKTLGRSRSPTDARYLKETFSSSYRRAESAPRASFAPSSVGESHGHSSQSLSRLKSFRTATVTSPSSAPRHAATEVGRPLWARETRNVLETHTDLPLSGFSSGRKFSDRSVRRAVDRLTKTPSSVVKDLSMESNFAGLVLQRRNTRKDNEGQILSAQSPKKMTEKEVRAAERAVKEMEARNEANLRAAAAATATTSSSAKDRHREEEDVVEEILATLRETRENAVGESLSLEEEEALRRTILEASRAEKQRIAVPLRDGKKAPTDLSRPLREYDHFPHLASLNTSTHDMSWIGGLREATARNTTRFVVKGGTSPKERFRSSSAQRWRNPLGPLETARNPSKGPGWFAERVGIEGGKEAGFDADGYSWTDGRVRSRSSSGDGSGLGSTGSERSLSNGSTRVGAKKVAPSVIDAFIKRTARYKTDREEWLKKKEEEKAAAERPVLKPTISESSRKLRRSLKDLYNWKHSLDERIEKKKEDETKKGAGELTLKPEINEQSRSLSRGREVLYQWDAARNRKLEERREREKAKKEEELQPRRPEMPKRTQQIVAENREYFERPATERLSDWALIHQMKREQNQKEQNIELKVARSPKINENSVAINEMRNYGGNAYSRLYKLNSQRMASVERKRRERLDKESRFDEETGQVLFTPSINRTSIETQPHRRGGVKEALYNLAEKKRERLERLRAEKEKEDKELMTPKTIPKSATLASQLPTTSRERLRQGLKVDGSSSVSRSSIALKDRSEAEDPDMTFRPKINRNRSSSTDAKARGGSESPFWERLTEYQNKYNDNAQKRRQERASLGESSPLRPKSPSSSQASVFGDVSFRSLQSKLSGSRASSAPKERLKKDFLSRSQNWLKERDEKRLLKKMELKDERMAECTFAPVMASQNRRRLSSSRAASEVSDGEGEGDGPSRRGRRETEREGDVFSDASPSLPISLDSRDGGSYKAPSPSPSPLSRARPARSSASYLEILKRAPTSTRSGRETTVDLGRESGGESEERRSNWSSRVSEARSTKSSRTNGANTARESVRFDGGSPGRRSTTSSMATSSSLPPNVRSFLQDSTTKGLKKVW